MCYQQSLHSFKNEHASLDTHKMAATSHLNINNAFSAMVNSKLDQDLKKSLTIQQKLSTHHATGEIFGNMGSAQAQTMQGQERIDSTVDRVFLRRNIGFNEMVFNEFGKDHLAEFKYERPNHWNLISRDPNKPNWLEDINESQYVMVHISLDTINEEFEKVDKRTMEILRTQYSLDVFDTWKSGMSPVKLSAKRRMDHDDIFMSPHSAQGSMFSGSSFNDCWNDGEYKSSVKQRHPLVFGTITDWRAMQMLKTFQATSIMCTTDAEQRECLEHYVFDHVNYDYRKHFKNLYKQQYQIL